MLGDDALETHLSPDTVVVDTTTSSPFTTTRIHERLESNGVWLLGSPISGGRDGAQAGTLTTMVGGNTDVVEQCRPLLKTYSDQVFHVGEQPQHGHTMKLLNNYLAYIALTGTAEAVVAGRKMGLSMETMLEVYNTSSGRNIATEVIFPTQILTEKYDTGYPLELAVKDLTLAVEIARKHGLSGDVGRSAKSHLDTAIDDNGATADVTTIYDSIRGQTANRDQNSSD
jgi:3-hydroxyisobutyrate dehydrogenase-like beta-hydroxyacid dehydrogenase